MTAPELVPGVYPSISELMPNILLSRIPASLAAEISERYETLGGKYLTGNFTEDGRQINGMMYTSRIDNCLEEIVDAVFCMLGWIFKSNLNCAGAIPDSAYASLQGLIEIYSLLKAEQANGTFS